MGNIESILEEGDYVVVKFGSENREGSITKIYKTPYHVREVEFKKLLIELIKEPSSEIKPDSKIYKVDILNKKEYEEQVVAMYVDSSKLILKKKISLKNLL